MCSPYQQLLEVHLIHSIEDTNAPAAVGNSVIAKIFDSYFGRSWSKDWAENKHLNETANSWTTHEKHPFDRLANSFMRTLSGFKYLFLSLFTCKSSSGREMRLDERSLPRQKSWLPVELRKLVSGKPQIWLYHRPSATLVLVSHHCYWYLFHVITVIASVIANIVYEKFCWFWCQNFFDAESSHHTLPHTTTLPTTPYHIHQPSHYTCWKPPITPYHIQ